MSPLPSPTPIRRVFVRALFSPAGLLFGFVVLLIATCPGARGDDAFDALALSELNSAAGLDGLTVAPAALPAAAARPSAPRQQVAPAAAVKKSSARSATPAERLRLAPAADTVSFRNSRAALPMLVDPLLADDGASARGRLEPLTGPTVGIPAEAPAARR